MTDINNLRYVNKCDINGIRKLIHSSYDINDGEIINTTRPGIITIKNDSPFGKFLKDGGCLHFYDDTVGWKENDSDKQHSISHEEFSKMANDVKVMLAIKKDKSNDVVYIDAENLFDLIDDGGNINDYNGITLDKTDAINTLGALNEMSNKKVSKNYDEGKKASWYERHGYYSKICIGNYTPVFNECNIQYNTRIGTKSINGYNQFILGYPAWPDYSKRGLEERNVRLLDPTEYMAEIERIIELQVYSIKNKGIKDLIVACPSDFLNSNALMAKGKDPNQYINAFMKAVLNVAERHSEIDIHVSNYGKFFDADLFKSENDDTEDSEFKHKNVFMCNYCTDKNKKKSKDKNKEKNYYIVLDAANLQKLDKFSNLHTNVALPINPHPQNGAGNGCLSKTGKQAFDENLARIMPTIPLLFNPDTNSKLNYVGNRAGILAETLTKNTAHKYNPKKIYMNRMFGDGIMIVNKSMTINDDDDTMVTLEEDDDDDVTMTKHDNNTKKHLHQQSQQKKDILQQQIQRINDFNKQYKDSIYKHQKIKINKLVDITKRAKSKKVKFDKIKIYIEGKYAEKKYSDDPGQTAFVLLSTKGETSDGKIAYLINIANSNNKNLLNNKKLLKQVKSPTSPIDFLMDGNQYFMKSFEGYGVRFSIFEGKAQVFLRDGEFFNNDFATELKPIVNGMIIEFPKDFDINNPKDANMFMMGKSNPFFVISYLKEKGCVFKDSNNQIINNETLCNIVCHFDGLTELKKQVDKLDKIYIENKTANPKTKKNANLEIICGTLMICATNEVVRKKFFGNKPLGMMNNINILVLNIIKEKPDFFDSVNFGDVGDPLDLNKIQHQFFFVMKNMTEEQKGSELGNSLSASLT